MQLLLPLGAVDWLEFLEWGIFLIILGDLRLVGRHAVILDGRELGLGRLLILVREWLLQVRYVLLLIEVRLSWFGCVAALVWLTPLADMFGVVEHQVLYEGIS